MEGAVVADSYQHCLTVDFYDCVDYSAALITQQDLLQQRQRKQISDRLLLLQHFPVYTMGRRDSYQDLRCPPQNLPAPLHRISRGGQITFHGPGQLVGYLIADLFQLPFGLKELVFRLESLFIELLQQQWNVTARRDAHHRGVWVGRNKIVALGIAIHQGVTMHGFAFNVNTDLSYYDNIIPCGIEDGGVTNLAQVCNEKVTIDEDLMNTVAAKVSAGLSYQGFAVCRNDRSTSEGKSA